MAPMMPEDEGGGKLAGRREDKEKRPGSTRLPGRVLLGSARDQTTGRFSRPSSVSRTSNARFVAGMPVQSK